MSEDHNPLISDTPDETLTNVAAVISFLQGTQPLEGCGAYEYDNKDPFFLGEYLVLGCVHEAITFEAARVEKMRKAGRLRSDD